jgi:hypothetical protein
MLPWPCELRYNADPVLTPVTPSWQEAHSGSDAHGILPAAIVAATFAMSPWQFMQLPLSEV